MKQWESRAVGRAKHYAKQGQRAISDGRRHFAMAMACATWEHTEVVLRLNAQTSRPHHLSRMDQHMITGLTRTMSALGHHARAVRAWTIQAKPTRPKRLESGRPTTMDCVETATDADISLAVARRLLAPRAGTLPAAQSRASGPSLPMRIVESEPGRVGFAFARKPPPHVASLLMIHDFVWDPMTTSFLRRDDTRARSALALISHFMGAE
jgi:hypothetical protein